MHQQLIRLFVTLSILLASSLAVAEESSTRSYPLPGYGAIQLQVPKSWRDKVHQPPQGKPPTIVFSPKRGVSFQVLLVPIFPIPQDMSMLKRQEEIRNSVRRELDRIKEQSIEKDIPVRELKSPSVAGYYFSATDRAPKAGEYKYMTQGMLIVGNIAPAFSIFSNDDAGDVLPALLSMMRSAVHVQQTP